MSEPIAKTTPPAGVKRRSLEGLRSLRIESDRRDTPVEAGRGRTFYLGRPGLAGAALLLALAGYVVAVKGPLRRTAVEVSRVVAAHGDAASALPSLTLTGYVVPRRKYVDLGATVPGRITWIGVEEGDRFSAGQVLARLDEAELRADRHLAAANLEAADARLSQLLAGPLPEELEQAKAQTEEEAAATALAGQTLRRQEELFRQGILSHHQLDAARSEATSAEARWRATREGYNLLRRGARPEVIRSARAEVARGRAALQHARSRLDEAVLRGPFSGVVLEKVREVGDSVVPGGVDRRGSGSAILRVAGDDDLRVEVEVSEVNLPEVKIGQSATVVLDAWPEKVFQARLVKVLPSANRQKGTVKAEVQLQAPDALVRPEMAAKVQLMEMRPLEPTQGASLRLLVPKGAIVPRPDGAVAFVLDGGRVRAQHVRPGAARGDLVEVWSGLAEGQYVVVKDQDGLRDGQRVRRAN